MHWFAAWSSCLAAIPWSLLVILDDYLCCSLFCLSSLLFTCLQADLMHLSASQAISCWIKLLQSISHWFALLQADLLDQNAIYMFASNFLVIVHKSLQLHINAADQAWLHINAADQASYLQINIFHCKSCFINIFAADFLLINIFYCRQLCCKYILLFQACLLQRSKYILQCSLLRYKIHFSISCLLNIF